MESRCEAQIWSTLESFSSEMGTGGMVGGYPHRELWSDPPIIKFLNGLRWGGTPKKISNWDDKIIKIAEKFTKIL